MCCSVEKRILVAKNGNENDAQNWHRWEEHNSVEHGTVVVTSHLEGVRETLSAFPNLANPLAKCSCWIPNVQSPTWGGNLVGCPIRYSGWRGGGAISSFGGKIVRYREYSAGCGCWERECREWREDGRWMEKKAREGTLREQGELIKSNLI